MEIRLEEPYASKWRKGYLRVNVENRRYIDLFNSNDDRTSTPYARYLMSVKMGVIVPDALEVDHIDDDKTNDDLKNLQLLTPEQNREKEALRKSLKKEMLFLACAYCGVTFLLSRREHTSRIKQNVEYICCSASCASKHAFHITKKSNNLHQLNPSIVLNDDQLTRLKMMKEYGHSQRLITEAMGVSRHVVQKYWHRV